MGRCDRGQHLKSLALVHSLTYPLTHAPTHSLATHLQQYLGLQHLWNYSTMGLQYMAKTVHQMQYLSNNIGTTVPLNY